MLKTVSKYILFVITACGVIYVSMLAGDKLASVISARLLEGFTF